MLAKDVSEDLDHDDANESCCGLYFDFVFFLFANHKYIQIQYKFIKEKLLKAFMSHLYRSFFCFFFFFMISILNFVSHISFLCVYISLFSFLFFLFFWIYNLIHLSIINFVIFVSSCSYSYS